MSWLENFRWAMNVARARRFRKTLTYGARRRFDDALRPIVGNHPGVFSYPDALYHIKVGDVIRAMKASAPPDDVYEHLERDIRDDRF